MVSIIKNQLLKHLSRFTKNLSADKINLSTFKGEGDLSNLELDEIVLTDLLELPSWLRLTSAWCNRVTFRIQWTKLKSVPIHLCLDEVNIIVETCEELRSMSAQGGLASYGSAPGKYSFIHKVIDGMTVRVNTVNITFNSPAFTASVQISRIVVESKSPGWEKSDLRMTRLKEPDRGQLLIFKELEWQTVRIEAKSTKDKTLTPLRLLTNQARCRITIKKRLSDCFVLGSRLVVILDDLLWVLTDSQLKAALHFLDSLAGLVQKANETTRKVKAARKLEVLPEYQAQMAQQARVKDSTTAISRIFARYDVVETSYHFLSQHIMLHLCDDPGAGRSIHPDLKDGGALQISLHKFQVDYYPYHLAIGNRKHWPKYKEASTPHTHWQEQALSSFRTKFIDLVDRHRPNHTPLSRSNQQSPKHEGPDQSPSSSHGSQSPSDASKKAANPVKQHVIQQLDKLMTTCVILRVEDFTLYRVTTSAKKQALKEFIAGDREHISLPDDTNIIHAEFTYFYYPGDIVFPLPPPKFFVQVNPIQIFFDIDSCLWFNSFALNLHQSLLASKKENAPTNLTYIDVKIEAILPRVIFESNVEHQSQRDRPKSLHFQVTRATITNVRSLEYSSRADLAKCVDSFHMGSLFFGSDFPSTNTDFYIVTQKFLDHISAADNIRSIPPDFNYTNVQTLVERLNRELFWIEAKDVWCINLDPVWADFFGARSVGSNRPIPFLDAVPVTVWLHANLDPNSTIAASAESSRNPRNAEIHALAHINNLVSLQINHYQYLFLLRMAEDAGELATFLSIDSNRILDLDEGMGGSIVIGALIPQLEITFVMPSQCPGKESSGGDLESFVPDSSSIPDDILVGGSAGTVWQTSTMSMTQMDSTLVNKKLVPNGAGTPISEISSSYSMDFVPQEKQKEALGPKGQSDGEKPVFIQPFTNIPNNFNVGLTSMKKGFTNLMSSIDSALKPDDASDTVSMRSDASSDSENYVVINYNETTVEKNVDAMFRVPGGNYDGTAKGAGIVEVASEAIVEDEANSVTSPSDRSVTSEGGKRRDLVSISTFKLSKVEFLQQSCGLSSSIKIQVENVANDDCNSIPWDEFQTKFSTRSRGWMECTPLSQTSSTTCARVKLRFDHDLSLPSSKSLAEIDLTDKNVVRKLFRDNLAIQVSDVTLELSMSSVTGLADLAEDEIIPIPVPIEISLNNIDLHLNEDRPPNNITSPGPIPIHLVVSQLHINRGLDGVFQIVPFPKTNLMSSSASSFSSATLEERESQSVQTRQLRSDNEELKRRLNAFERVSEENRLLRRSKEETDILRSCLNSAQDEVSRLLEEKKKLLEDIRRLQDQLNVGERSRQWVTKR